MEFDGSLTPPLTEDEDSDSDSLSCHHSPILNKRLKLDEKTDEVIISSDNQSRTENDSHCDPLLDNNLFSILSFMPGMFFSDEERVTSLFYKCVMCIRHVHQFATGETHNVHYATDAREGVLALLHSVSVSVEEMCQENFEDKVFLITELVLMLSTETASVANDGHKHVHKYVAEKFRFSDVAMYLHHCGNKELCDWFHLYPVVHIQTLDILQSICQKLSSATKLQVSYSNGEPVMETEGMLAQYFCRITRDMLVMSSGLYKQLVLNENGAECSLSSLVVKRSFPCECFLTFLKNCTEKLGESIDFWNIVGNLINNILQNVKAANENGKTLHSSSDKLFQCEKDAINFAWWWVKDVWFPSQGDRGSTLITRLIRLSLTKCALHDEYLAYQLHCYSKVIKAIRTSPSDAPWDSSQLASFHLLWRHFSAKLNAVVPTHQQDIRNFIPNELCIRDWIDECKLLDEVHTDNLERKNSDSFFAFLSVLQTLLKESKGSVWEQIKDRFFSRIQINVMKQLNELGIYRFFSVTSLLLLYCTENHAPSILAESTSLIRHCPLTRAGQRKQQLIVTGLFASMHVCLERKVMFEVLVTHAATFFLHLCRSLLENSAPGSSPDVYKLFAFYLRRVLDLLRDSPNFLNGQIGLIPPNSLSTVVEKRGPADAQIVVTFAKEILACLRAHCEVNDARETGCIRLASRLVDELQPWLNQHMLSNGVHPVDVPFEIARDMTCLSVHFESSSSFSTLWMLFATQAKVDGIWRWNFLCSCLKQADVISRLNADYEVANSCARKSGTASELCDAAVQGWIKCSFFVSSSNKTFNELNQALMNLQPIKELHDDLELSFASMIKSLSKQYSLAKDFLSRVKWTDVANRWFLPSVDTALRIARSPRSSGASIVHVYCVVGSVIEHCSDMLYANSKPSFVSRIFDNLICFRDKVTVAPSRLHEVHNALLVSLHKFIIGLLQPRVNALYTQKIMKQIVKSYLVSWPCVNTVNGTEYLHPFLRVLKCSLTEAKNNFLGSILAYTSSVALQTKDTLSIVEILHYWLKADWSSDSALKTFDCIPKFVPFLQQARVQLRTVGGCEEKVNALLHAFRC